MPWISPKSSVETSLRTLHAGASIGRGHLPGMDVGTVFAANARPHRNRRSLASADMWLRRATAVLMAGLLTAVPVAGAEPDLQAAAVTAPKGPAPAWLVADMVSGRMDHDASRCRTPPSALVPITRGTKQNQERSSMDRTIVQNVSELRRSRKTDDNLGEYFG